MVPYQIEKLIRCYDNGGSSADRYTVLYLEPDEEFGEYSFVGMDHQPFWPQGVCMHSSAPHLIDLDDDGKCPEMGEACHLGERIPYSELPPDCRRVVRTDLSKGLPWVRYHEEEYYDLILIHDEVNHEYRIVNLTDLSDKELLDRVGPDLPGQWYYHHEFDDAEKGFHINHLHEKVVISKLDERMSVKVINNVTLVNAQDMPVATLADDMMQVGDVTNAGRAHKALATLRSAYTHRDQRDVLLGEAVTDLLVDLQHLCRMNGQSFEQLVERSDSHAYHEAFSPDFLEQDDES